MEGSRRAWKGLEGSGRVWKGLEGSRGVSKGFKWEKRYLQKCFYFSAYGGLALKEKADKTFYLAYDLLPKDNPAYHHKDFYSYNDVEGQNKLRTPQINNITLKVRQITEKLYHLIYIKCFQQYR